MPNEVRYRLLPTIAVCLFAIPGLQAQASFQFNGTDVRPGTKEHFTIKISDNDGNKAQVPITVFHGQSAGPVLGITAGVHGYEYAPILAGQQLINRINPAALSGTVILVQIANVGSFLGRSPYTNPMDSKNLNRTFPGNAEGSVTERLAHFISTKVIPRSDYFIDMHSGDAPEDLMAYSAYYQHDDKPEISKKGRMIAESMGYDLVVVFKTTTKDYMKDGFPSLYCSAEAFKQGIPAADIECGRLGMIEPHLVDKITTAIERTLISLGMAEGKIEPVEKMAVVKERLYIESEHEGFFYPLKSSGDYVLKGMKVGYVTDLFNRTVQEIHATENGLLLFILGTPPVNKGESVATVAVIEE